MGRLEKKIKSLRIRLVLIFLILVCNVVVEVAFKLMYNFLKDVITVDPVIVYLSLNTGLLLITMMLCYKSFWSGLVSLCCLKKNCNVPIAFAAIVSVWQLAFCFVFKERVALESMHVYSLLAVSSFFFTLLGDFVCEKRVQTCFEFLSLRGIKKSICLLENKNLSRRLLNDVRDPKIGYTRRAGAFENLHKTFYSMDPSTVIISNISLVTCLYCLIIGVVQFILKKDFFCALSAITVSACMCVPMSLKLISNFPLKKVNKGCVKADGMISGFQSVKKFGNVSSVIVNDADLYPRRKISLQGIKTFNGSRIDEALISAFAVVSEADGLLKHIFSKIVKGKINRSLKATDVMFEDGKGLIGWVNGKRILAGNRNFLKKYGVFPPSHDYEKKYFKNQRQITYFAVNNELVAMFVLKYKPNRDLIKELKRLQNLGVTILVRTLDSNVTAELIARDFKIYYDSVKIISSEDNLRIKDDVRSEVETDEPYAVTFGSARSFVKVIVSCIKAKLAINLGITAGVMSFILGIALVSLLIFCTTIGHIGSLELFMYSLLWTACISVVQSLFLCNRRER